MPSIPEAIAQLSCFSDQENIPSLINRLSSLELPEGGRRSR